MPESQSLRNTSMLGLDENSEVFHLISFLCTPRSLSLIALHIYFSRFCIYIYIYLILVQRIVLLRTGKINRKHVEYLFRKRND
jgi:hypothetical protein